MTADDIDDDHDFPALREQLGCARLHPGTLCGKKTFHVHELSSVDNDSDVDVKMGLDVMLMLMLMLIMMILMLMLRWDWR